MYFIALTLAFTIGLVAFMAAFAGFEKLGARVENLLSRKTKSKLQKKLDIWWKKIINTSPKKLANIESKYLISVFNRVLEKNKHIKLIMLSIILTSIAFVLGDIPTSIYFLTGGLENAEYALGSFDADRNFLPSDTTDEEAQFFKDGQKAWAVSAIGYLTVRLMILLYALYLFVYDKTDLYSLIKLIVVGVLFVLLGKNISLIVDICFLYKTASLNQYIYSSVAMLAIIFILIFLKKEVSISKLLLIIPVVIFFLLFYHGNMSIGQDLSFNYFFVYTIDGLINRFSAIYFYNYIFDFLTILVAIYTLNKISISSNFKSFLLLLMNLVLSFTLSLGIYVLYNMHIYNIKLAFEGSSFLNTSVPLSFFEYLESVALTSLSEYDFSLTLYAITTFIPITFFVIYAIVVFVAKLIERNFAILTKLLYFNRSKQKKKTGIYLTIIIVGFFISLISSIGIVIISFDDLLKALGIT